MQTDQVFVVVKIFAVSATVDFYHSARVTDFSGLSGFFVSMVEELGIHDPSSSTDAVSYLVFRILDIFPPEIFC